MVSESDIIFSLTGVSKSYGARDLLNDVSLSFLKGARIGVIGANGMGKSTLLKIMAREDQDYEGDVIWAPGTRVVHVWQEPELDVDLTVRENVELAVQPIRDKLQAFDDISAKLGEPLEDDEMNQLMEKMGRLQDEIEALDAWEIDRQIEQAMMALHLPPGDRAVTNLSGGERRRIALCRALLEQPDLLLLDEPTNHLDAATVAWLERHLQAYKGTIVLVTHDRYFLDNVVGWMLEIDRGEFRPYQGNYSEYLEARQSFYAQRQKSDDERAKLIARELDWVRQNPKGRTTKSKARVQRYEDLVDTHRQAVREDFRLHIPFTKRLGAQVLEVRDVTKAYEGRTLFEGVTFDVPPGAILGVVGPNGAGKTTMMRMIVGEEEPDAGTVTRGETVDLCYLDQSREELSPDKTVYDEITDGREHLDIGGVEVKSRAYVARFNFRGGDQQKLMRELSGGERNRVQMAKMLARGGNFILLDEPTNDLDLPTLRHLEEALLEFPGCVIVVTHDRWFLDRLATHILAFDGEGGVEFHPGNYESWRAHLRNLRLEQGLSPDEPVGVHRKFGGS